MTTANSEETDTDANGPRGKITISERVSLEFFATAFIDVLGQLTCLAILGPVET